MALLRPASAIASMSRVNSAASSCLSPLPSAAKKAAACAGSAEASSPEAACTGIAQRHDMRITLRAAIIIEKHPGLLVILFLPQCGGSMASPPDASP